MSDEIRCDAEGYAFMASIRPAWHHKENLVEKGTPLNEWMDICGMNTAVLKLRAGYDFNGNFLFDGESYATVDEKRIGEAPYAFVSDRYNVHQRKEVIEKLVTPMLDFGLMVCSMGQLREGALIWVQCESEKGFYVKDELITKRLLAFTSYDGSQATGARYVNEMVVCANTFAIAISEKGNRRASVRHSKKLQENGEIDLTPILQAIGLMDETTERLEHDYNMLSERKVSKAEIDAFWLSTFGKAKDSDKPLSFDNLTTQSSNQIDALQNALGMAPGADLEARRGNALGLLNAVTYYVDHVGRAHSYQNQQYNAMFGKGAALKESAFSTLLTMAVENTYSPLMEAILTAATPAGILESVLAETV